MATKDLRLLGSEDNIFWATFNDIAIQNGDIATLTGVNKIRQEIVKFLFIQIGTVSLFQNYGTNIPFLMNNRVSNSLFQDLKNEIIYACKYVQQINANEPINISVIKNIQMTNPTPRELAIAIDLELTDGNVLRIDQTINSL